MSIFGGSVGKGRYQTQQRNLATVAPDERERAAGQELQDAEQAYSAAESRLIKARRAYAEASREWNRFYHPEQEQN